MQHVQMVFDHDATMCLDELAWQRRGDEASILLFCGRSLYEDTTLTRDQPIVAASRLEIGPVATPQRSENELAGRADCLGPNERQAIASLLLAELSLVAVP